MRRYALVLSFAILSTVLVPPAARAAETVTIRGGGWGHGIGMSQYGAYGRALNGWGTNRILKKYYTGVDVARRNVPAIRVGLLQYMRSISASSSAYTAGGGKVVWKEQGVGRIASGGANASWRVEPSSTGGLLLFENGRQVIKDGRRVFGDPSHPLRLFFERYGTLVDVKERYGYAYGVMEFATHASNNCGGYCLRLVLKLPMQKYLYGLSEVPSSWPAAVLRAQAIAGRTYAYEKTLRSQHREPCDCAVYDSVIDQAFTGDDKRVASGAYWDEWMAAVDATDGRVILHNGAPISALYSSSSGGHTENNENVWGGTPVAYLRGVRDGADRAGGRNPNYSWKIQMPLSEFEAKLNARFGTGSLEKFEVVGPRGVSGRVTVVKSDGSGGVRIVGSQKTVRASGWDIRSALSLKDTLFWVDIDYDVGERFVEKYRRLSGAPGDATGAPYSVPKGWKRPRGRAQDFQRGRMTWTKALDKTVWQRGRVLRKYDRMGREKSVLGMPRSDTWGPGRYLGANYDGGMIVWSKETGARTVRDAFRSAYRRNGGVKGALGLPTAERHKRETLPNGGKRQRFQSGTLYLNPALDQVFALWGAVDPRYRQMGEASSRCGYPTGDVSGDEQKVIGVFERGTITWTADAGFTIACS